MKKRWFLFLICLSLVSCTFFFVLKTTTCKKSLADIEKVLDALSYDDRASLEWFFRYLSESSSAYVLFGDKPMAICSFREAVPCPSEICLIEDFMDSFFGSINVRNLRMQKGWKVWKKNEHLFPSTNFILLENRGPRHNNWVTIVLINKQAFLKEVEDSIVDFKKALSTNITPQEILENCLKGNAIFEDVLNYHDGLLGILLGYGKHNAQLFFRKIQMEGIRELQKFSLTKNSLLPSEGFLTLEDEYNDLNQRLSFFDEGEILDLNPLFMTLPGFMADHNSIETQQLKIKYRKQYKKIINKYKKGRFLEVTLEQFCHAYEMNSSS